MVMIAKRTGRVRIGGSPRLVRKGVTTADEGADIVRSHPHLWGPLEVDYPATYLAWPDPPAGAAPADDGVKDVAELRADYDSACRTVAEMHAAAVGSVRGPIRGVVEDVEDLRVERDELRRQVDELTATAAAPRPRKAARPKAEPEAVPEPTEASDADTA